MCGMESPCWTTRSRKSNGRDCANADLKLSNSPDWCGKLQEMPTLGLQKQPWSNFGLKKAIYMPMKYSSFGLAL